MCVVSMIMDHYGDKWSHPPYVFPNWSQPFVPQTPDPEAIKKALKTFLAIPKQITAEEIREFRELLERAREYDKRNNEPDCELASKKARVKALADDLGVQIDFL